MKAEYNEALKRYDAEKGRYVSERQAFEAKIAAGQQKVKELNDRFADWYYVISNDSFDKLRISRSALVKSKEKPADKPDAEKKETEKTDGDQPADKPDAEKKESDKPAEKGKEEKGTDETPKKEKGEKTEKTEEKTDKKEAKPADDK